MTKSCLPLRSASLIANFAKYRPPGKAAKRHITANKTSITGQFSTQAQNSRIERTQHGKETKHSISAGRKPLVDGELRSGPIAGTALVNGATFSQKPLLYANVDGEAIFEGDIVLGSVQDLQQGTPRDVALRSIGITGSQFRWPNGVVPYEIDPGLPNQQRVTDAIAHWETNTTIRFTLRTAANQAQFPDFVRFVSGGGCSSFVGKQGGQQNITLGSGCTAGNAIHEIGHTIGLWHDKAERIATRL